MNQTQQTGELSLSRREMVPATQRVGARELEVTFLGNNTQGHPTWILWNPQEPYLIGVLIQGTLGFNFEQRTDQGVLLHENVSLQRLQRALGAL